MRRPPVVDVGRDEAWIVKYGADSRQGWGRQIGTKCHQWRGSNRGGYIVREAENQRQADDPANDAPQKIGGIMTVGIVHVDDLPRLLFLL